MRPFPLSGVLIAITLFVCGVLQTQSRQTAPGKQLPTPTRSPIEDSSTDYPDPGTWLTEPLPEEYATNLKGESAYQDDKIWRVSDRHMQNATQLLASQSVVKLDQGRAEELVGHALQLEDGLSAYLVRAVKPRHAVTDLDSPPNPNRFFRIWHDPDFSIIAIKSLGIGRPTPTVPYPLVILLPREPQKVFVLVSGMM